MEESKQETAQESLNNISLSATFWEGYYNQVIMSIKGSGDTDCQSPWVVSKFPDANGPPFSQSDPDHLPTTCLHFILSSFTL